MTTRFMDPVPGPRRLLSALTILAAFGLVSWLAGCSVLVDANRAQCSTDADCKSRGAEFAGAVCKSGLCEGGSDAQWSCSSAAPADVLGYKLTMHLTDAQSTKPLQGVVAQLCRNLDDKCAEPVGPVVTSDDAGVVTMQVEPGFNGYVQLTSSRIAPSLYFLTPPASGDLDLPMVPLASPLAAAAIVSAASGGMTWAKETSGIVLLTAVDCQGKPAANINFSVAGMPDPNTFIFYVVGDFPTTDVSVTDTTGYGGLVNVPAKNTTIYASLEPDGRKVSQISILVRAGYVSYSSVTPNSL